MWCRGRNLKARMTDIVSSFVFPPKVEELRCEVAVKGAASLLEIFANTLSPELRIHEHTERGDNDTVKMPNGQKVVIDGKTCADK
jgi:hypothetical protein